MDGISVLARSLVEAVQDDRTVQFKLGDGSLLEGQLHPTFSVAEARTIGGRTLDLEAAYKQVLVARSSLWANVLAVTDSSGVKRFFLGHVLPFGASAAVFGFNRIARAILTIGSRLFWAGLGLTSTTTSQSWTSWRGVTTPNALPRS